MLFVCWRVQKQLNMVFSVKDSPFDSCEIASVADEVTHDDQAASQ